MTKAEAKHLVFYDGKCGFCDRVVVFLLKQNQKKQFLFAPLQGETAQRELKEMPDPVKQADSLILIENYQTPEQKISIFGKGAFRIAWLLGGKWGAVGWLSFLPSFLYDWGYRLVARNRHLLSSNVCKLPDPSQKDRFLP